MLTEPSARNAGRHQRCDRCRRTAHRDAHRHGRAPRPSRRRAAAAPDAGASPRSRRPARQRRRPQTRASSARRGRRRGVRRARIEQRGRRSGTRAWRSAISAWATCDDETDLRRRRSRRPASCDDLRAVRRSASADRACRRAGPAISSVGAAAPRRAMTPVRRGDFGGVAEFLDRDPRRVRAVGKIDAGGVRRWHRSPRLARSAMRCRSWLPP